MTAHKNARPDFDAALHTMTHPRQKEPAKDQKEPPQQHEEKKEFHVTRLHDGSFHHVQRDGIEPDKEGSAQDLDGVHEALHQHFGTPNEGEERQER
jgi:hypothetical protein